MEKPDDNCLTQQDGVGRKIGAACGPNKVGSSGLALYRAS